MTLTGKYLVLISDCEQMAVVGEPFDTVLAASEFAEKQDGIDWLIVEVVADRALEEYRKKVCR